MTELEHIEIEGFKGIEHVEFEPTDINLITGRNNTGKTSFLEAVHLSSNPQEIRGFNQNVGAVINRSRSEAVIKTKKESETDELVIRPASTDEIDRYFREIVKKHLYSVVRTGTKRTNSDGSLLSYSSSQKGENEEIGGVFHEIIASVARRVTDQKISDFLRTVLVLETDKTSYPYFYFGTSNYELSSAIHDELGKVIESQTDLKHWEEHTDAYIVSDPETESRIIEFETGYSRVIQGGLFIEKPPNEESIRFIKSVESIDRPGSTEVEENAIRVDDIGDFIKEKGIVDRLKTFNLEALIFEDESGEKYSVPYTFMGDGFKSVVCLLWKLMDEETENNIVLIEEPETHMHPGYIREVVYFLIKLAREENIQLFITTHDSDFINDFFTENLTDEEEAYLEDEFSLLRMEEDSAVVEDYQTARENLEDLHLDLRGI